MKVKLYTCQVCSRTFSSRQALGGHVQMHNRHLRKLQATSNLPAVIETNSLPSADDICTEVLSSLQPTIPTSALKSVLHWHTATAEMLEALK